MITEDTTITLVKTELGQVVSEEDFDTIVLGLGIGLAVVIICALAGLFTTKNNKRKKR